MIQLSRMTILTSCAALALLTTWRPELAAAEVSPGGEAQPQVQEGVWVVPEFDLRLPAPEGWVPRELRGRPALCASQEDRFSDRIELRRTPRRTEDLDELRTWLVHGQASRRAVFQEISVVKVGGTEALFERTRRLKGRRDETTATLHVPRGDEMLLVTATVATSRWSALEAQIETSLAGLRSDSVSEEDDQRPRKLLRTSTVEHFAPLRLPVSSHANVDERDAGEYRAVINVQADGRIVALHEDLLNLPPASRLDDDSLKAILDWLYRAVLEMEKEGADEETALPTEDLLLRADASTPFYFAQKVMERCGSQQIMLWKIDLAVALEPDAVRDDSRESRGTEGVLHAYLPRHTAFDRQKVEVLLEVKKAGEKLDPRTGEPWSGEPGTSFVHASDRRLAYTIAGRSTAELKHVSDFLKRFDEAEGEWTVTIDARIGVTCGEVVQVMDAALDAGLTEITFVGSYE